MIESPKVSVLIPVFNDQTGLNRCVAALEAQSYPRSRLEIIIIDNGSVPPIRVNSTTGGLTRIVLCSIPGAYAARNAGIGIASGDVLAFTDADCVPDRNWVAAGVHAIQHSAYRAVVGGHVNLELSERPSATERYQYLTGFMQRENIESRGFGATANLFVGRGQLERIGLFEETLLSGGDREWCWRARQAGFGMEYVANAIVTTSARRSLSGAIRQARRVAGGRYGLRAMRVAHVTSSGIQPHRTGLAAVKWILSHPDLSSLSKLQVLAVASTVRIVSIFEMFRLRFSENPERR